ncbi:hypothetical protein L226DRAFT_611742 [Lentinus tigrinus ALCF2SS1-7]|uniref:Uncharacterized protein n=1 Tax=Lentinus tigrinus ALCF2SS1-6 TaxID=1328759 RepID=A0A5C2SK75_9APHY|nr:hypothetical protein L227DRAFT_571716 [Lentinus tigrinus ALCF2SS1-6]RPD76344.1 hypothetical protein L226DRAFT_611742 [Lentinus tigrinus ALCF2SS1-7]
MSSQPCAPSVRVPTVGELVRAAGLPGGAVGDVPQADIPLVRAAMLRSIEAYQAAIMEIKTGLNMLTPIGRLPRELLAEIMTSVARDYYFNGHYDRVNRHPLHWIKVTTHVCRTWRFLALDTPALWAYITLDMENEHFLDFIARSKKAPLFVTTFVPRYGPRPAVVKMAVEGLSRESDRLQELLLRAPVRYLQTLCAGMKLPAGLLRTLTLDARDSGESDHGRTAPAKQTLVALPEAFPNLRHLEIRNLPVKWQDAIFMNPSVTSLTVTAFFDRSGRKRSPEVGRFKDLLLALELLAPSLQSLTLEESIPRLPADTTKVPSPTRILSFPALRSIRLVGDVVDCARLMRHMSTPVIVSISIRTYGNIGVAEIAQRLSEDFTRTEPWQDVSLGTSSRSVDLMTWTGSTLYERRPVDLSFNVSAGMPIPLPAICSQVGVWFRTLRRLSMSGLYETMNWREFFARTPQLEELHIDSLDPPQGFFDALHPTSRPHSKYSIALLPHLRRVELEYIAFHSRRGQRPAVTANDAVEFFPAFIRVLKSRASANSPLAELHIYTCIRVQAVDVKALKEIVADVQWDAQEDMDGPSGDCWSDSDSDRYDSDGMSIHGDPVDAETDSEEVEETDEEELTEEQLAAEMPVWVT